MNADPIQKVSALPSAPPPVGTRNYGGLPRNLGALLALICGGGAIAFSVWQETPVGRVRGNVLLDENDKPLAGVKVVLTPVGKGNSDEDGKIRRLRAVTNKEGEYQFARIAVGSYHLSAASRAHSTGEARLAVDEDQTSDIRLTLKRSQPDLQATQQQKDFTPGEKITIPLHGYVDGKKAAGKDTLRVRVFRTTLSNILGDAKAAEALSRIGNNYDNIPVLPAILHPISATPPKLISSRAEPIREADIEGFYHKRLNLGVLSPGLYIVDVAHGSNSVSAKVMVSNTALILKKTRDQILAFAVDSQSGTPRPNAAIRVLKSGKVVARAQSDSQGLARIKLPRGDEDSGGRLLTVASFGASEATVGQYDYEGEEDEGHGDFTVHAYTERPIYRPGDKVFYKGIARRTLDTGLRYAVAAGEGVDLEVRDPSGERIAKEHLATNRFGSFHGKLELSPESPTGTYSIVMTVRGEEHTADFRVASYRKPEFSATVTPNEKHYAYGDEVQMFVDATYYFGAPVAGAKVRYTITRAPDWSSMYKDEEGDEEEDLGYEGEGNYGDGSGESVREGEATLDENGHAIISFAAEREKKDDKSDSEWYDEQPQDQNYSVQVTVIDAAKREVEASGEVPVSAGDFRLSTRSEGYFALPGKATKFSVVAKDFAGKPVANAPIEIASSYRKWDEETSKSATIPARNYRAVTNAEGIAQISIVPSKEGVLFLEARAQDSKQRAIVATRSLWIADENGGDYDAQYSDLSLLTDKKRYSTGETARVLLNSEKRGGTALLTLEGSKLYRSWLVPLSKRSTALRVPITADYGPNVTLVACLVRDKKFAQSQAPLRVDVPQRDVKIAIQADRQKYQPGEKVTYGVQTTNAQGQPIACEVSFGVVDEAIYALQEDDPRALRNAFYPRQPNSVSTGYSFEPLYLGDVNKATPVIEARKKFVDTAYWQPDVQTDASGRASVSFALPDNLTTWRATAVAQTQNSAFGRKTQTVVVAKDFFVRLETPRFFTGGDNAQVTALIHNETGQPQDATVKLEADGLTLGGEDTQSVNVAEGAVGQITWPIATQNAGLNFSNRAHFKLSAWTPQNGGAQFSDAIENTIPVRPHGREKIVNFVGQLSSGTATHPLAIDAGAIPAASQVSIRITPSVSDALAGALKYLVGFPYGCTEQTMSRFLPDILVQRTLRLKGLQDAESQKLAARLPRMVRDGLTRLARFQHESGGWGWWEADGDDPWMTAYVLYGLSQARAEGYAVNAETMARGRAAALTLLKRDTKKLPPWQLDNWENTRAFLLYVVAGASPTAKELAQIRNERAGIFLTGLDSQALGYLTLLDKQLGQSRQSGAAWTELEKQIVVGDDGTLSWKGSGREEWADWDDKTATALGLRALISQNPNDPRIARVLQWLMLRRQDDNWGNTRDTAWVLGALCDYLNARGKPVASGNLKVRLNNGVLSSIALGQAQSHGEIVLRVPWQKLRSSNNVVTLQRDGGGEPIFYTVGVRQTIGSDAPLEAVASSIPIGITREYLRITSKASGANSWKLQSEPTNNQLKQGDRIRVRLSFDVPRDLSYVLIEDAFPSGCETTERGSADAGSEDWDYWWSNSDVRDDRIAFFARRLSKGKHVIEYNLRAQTPGVYNALPAMLQAMYAPEVRAETGETSITIR